MISNWITVKSRPCATAYQQLPIRCVQHEMGAMKVYSIVPSQRSIVIISVTPSNVTLRYDQTAVPMRRVKMKPACSALGKPGALRPIYITERPLAEQAGFILTLLIGT